MFYLTLHKEFGLGERVGLPLIFKKMEVEGEK
jgi:hypothetical protein